MCFVGMKLLFGNVFKECQGSIRNKVLKLIVAQYNAKKLQSKREERFSSVTQAEGVAEAATIITVSMERTGNAVVEVRRIDAAKEIKRHLILNKVNPVRMIVCVLFVKR